MDSLHCFPAEAVEAVRAQKAWMASPKHFKRVKMAPAATIKMLMHGQQGVEKGINRSGKPIEVMGLLVGRPDTEDLSALIVTEAFPLPIEGFETRVVADDGNVMNYMIELGESMESSRNERFCGWYHTHPFDLDGTSHCFMSNTDITTQLQWQRSEDPNGNPWLALVIDPLYSLANNAPEIKAFRVFPPEHAGAPDETPNGQIVRDDRRRVEQWGACWNRYYELDIEYFMSAMTQATLNTLRNKFLWFSALAANPNAAASAALDTAPAADQAVHRLNRTLKSLVGTVGPMGVRAPREAEEVGGQEPAGREPDRGAGRLAAQAAELGADCACRMSALRLQHALLRCRPTVSPSTLSAAAMDT